MSDKIEGFLEVGLNDKAEIVVNHPDLKTDADGVGHIVFSARQAHHLGNLLLHHARQSENSEYATKKAKKKAAMEAAEAVPVDRSSQVLSNGSPVTPEHKEINPVTGQQKGYVVLTEEERAKGFVCPVRRTYLHKVCGTTTTMNHALAETYARDPGFYSGTFCCYCKKHLPLTEFVWDGTDEQVGS